MVVDLPPPLSTSSSSSPSPSGSGSSRRARIASSYPSELFSRRVSTDAIHPRGSKTSREPRLHVEPSAEHRPNVSPPRHLRREVPQQRQDGPLEVSILRVSDERRARRAVFGLQEKRKRVIIHQHRPSRVPPERREIFHVIAHGRAHARVAVQSRVHASARIDHVAQRPRVSLGARGEHHRLGKLGDGVEKPRQTRSHEHDDRDRGGRTFGRRRARPTQTILRILRILRIGAERPRRFRDSPRRFVRPPPGPRRPERDPGPRRAVGDERLGRRRRRQPERSVPRRDARFRETRRDRVGVVRAHERLVQIQNHAQRVAFPRRRRREKRAGTIGTRSGGGIVHPSANRAISGGGEGRSGRALRVVDGTERRGGVLSAGDGVDDGRGRVFVALRAARGRARGRGRGRGEPPSVARGKAPTRAVEECGGDARFAEVHDPSSDGRGKRGRRHDAVLRRRGKGGERW